MPGGSGAAFFFLLDLGSPITQPRLLRAFTSLLVAVVAPETDDAVSVPIGIGDSTVAIDPLPRISTGVPKGVAL